MGLSGIFLYCMISCLSLASAFRLTILHTNDQHSEIEQFNPAGLPCSPAENASGECYGGVARRYTAVRGVRESEENVLFVDAGDAFQGSKWFDVYQGRANAHFMSRLGYDAMTLGNHELDNGVEGFLPFLREVNFPVLSSNTDTSDEPELAALMYKRLVMSIGGELVGVLGYITTMAPVLTRTGNLTFENEATALQREVDKLQAIGVDKIIAVGHAGYGADIDIARAVSGIDVIVGGHTSTFLYTGPPPSSEEPIAPYPTVVQSEVDPSHRTLLVTAFSYGKYLGHLLVEFDPNGVITTYGGNPILLDSTIAEDPDVLNEVAEWSGPVSSYGSEVIGQSYVLLPGKFDGCDEQECGLGNLITDAFIWRSMENRGSRGWSDVGIALLNSGSIRNSLNIGNITVQGAAVLNPFSATLVKVTMSGRHLLLVLEQSLERYGLLYQYGAFLQVSGLLLEIDPSQPLGSRISTVLARCIDCLQPAYEPLQMDQAYRIVISSFIADGGDGLSTIPEYSIDQYDTGIPVKEAIAEYIKARSPITQGVENRIVLINQGE